MTINSQMSDAELAAHMTAHNGGQRLIVDAWNEARKLYEKTKAVALPRRALDAEYDRYRRSGFERPELLPVNVATLRAALKLKEFMTAFWTRWNGASAAEIGAMWKEEYAPQPIAAPMPAAPPRFDAGAFIGDMARKGCRIDARGDAITATPVERLSESDKAVIRAHKAELIAALASAAVIA